MDRPYLQITERHQQIYKLISEENRSIEDVAEIVGVSQTYVKQSLELTRRRLEAAEIAAKNPDNLFNLNLPDRTYTALRFNGNINSISELREFIKSQKLTDIRNIGPISEKYILKQLAEYTQKN